MNPEGAVPVVAVVIPSLDEGPRIGACLDSLPRAGDGGPAVEVVVADNGSSDGTVHEARRRGIAVVENTTGSRLSISALRNVGAAATRAPILLFLDADMILPRGLIDTALAIFAERGPGALGFVEAISPEAGWVGRIWGERALRLRRDVTATDFLPGRNLFVRREIFREVGGFNEALRTSEDKDFTLRISAAGHEVLSVPGPNPVHLGYEKDFAEFVRKEFWRQGDTLAFARVNGYSWRVLRNVVFSLGHLAAGCTALATALSGETAVAAGVAVAWIMPAAMLATRGDAPPGGALLYRVRLFLLLFARWNAAGVALGRQVLFLAAGRGR